MKVTFKEKKVIENYLNYYYAKHKGCNESLPFKTQMGLLYDHLTDVVTDNDD
jgi:hypothetical protein